MGFGCVNLWLPYCMARDFMSVRARQKGVLLGVEHPPMANSVCKKKRLTKKSVRLLVSLCCV